jgi:hypothetical protein
MPCRRCQAEVVERTGWCLECELAYDGWSRRHAGDIVWCALSGTVVVLTAGMLVPALGVSWLFALTGVFAGFGTMVGLFRWNRRRRRGQFLRGAAVPRAYLPEQT